MRGTRCGVFIGCDESEYMMNSITNVEQTSGYMLFGCARSMFANRISYAFDLRGPSFIVDTGELLALILQTGLFSLLGIVDGALASGERHAYWRLR